MAKAMAERCAKHLTYKLGKQEYGMSKQNLLIKNYFNQFNQEGGRNEY
jgi:hypothetical protein